VEFSLGSLLNPMIDVLSFAIVSLAIFFVRRQKLSQYRDGKTILLLVYGSLLVILGLDFLKSVHPTTDILLFYTIVGASLALADGPLLSTFAYIIYVRPPEQRVKERLKAILGPRLVPHGLILISYSAYVTLLISYFVILEPFTEVTLVNLAGFPTASTRYSPDFQILLAPATAFFLSYGGVVLLLGAKKATNRSTRHSMWLVSFGWIVIAIALAIFDVYLPSLGYETSALAYFVVAVALSGSVFVFRRATALEEFFQLPVTSIPETHPFSKRIRGREYSIQGRAMLLEVDPSSNYEQVVKDFAVEQISNAGSFFVFTSKGGSVYRTLVTVPETRFFIMTGAVSYSRSASRSLEMEVPQGDPGALLRCLEMTLTSIPQSNVGLAFDSLSDSIHLLGFEKLYKFLKQVIEMIDQHRVTALFLILAGAHDEIVRNSIKGLFGSQLFFDANGLYVTKEADSTPPAA